MLSNAVYEAKQEKGISYRFAASYIAIKRIVDGILESGRTGKAIIPIPSIKTFGTI